MWLVTAARKSSGSKTELDPLRRQKSLAPQHPEHPVPEQLLDRRQAQRRQRVEDPVRCEAAVGGHDVQVGVEVEQIPERVHADNQPGLGGRLAE